MRPRLVTASAEEEQLAQALAVPGKRLAFLRFEGRVYFARHASEPVSRLIEGIYELEPAHAREIVRARIFTTDPKPGEACLGMLKVAAKRLSPVSAVEHGLRPVETLVEVPEIAPDALAPLPGELAEAFARAREPGDFLAIAARLAEAPASDAPLFERDRPIAALLVGPDGRLLAWSRNAGARNRTRHAELRAVRAWRAAQDGAKLPAGTTVYSTLKPCRMCAGLLWDSAADRARLVVWYGEHDPGPNARVTVLDPGSPERMRAAADAEERARVLERLWGR